MHSSVPKYPHSNEVEDPRTKAMLVLASGCDSLTSRMKDRLGPKYCCKVRKLMMSKKSIKEKRDLCLETVSKKTLHESTMLGNWKTVIISLTNSIVHDPVRNGHARDENP